MFSLLETKFYNNLYNTYFVSIDLPVLEIMLCGKEDVSNI